MEFRQLLDTHRNWKTRSAHPPRLLVRTQNRKSEIPVHVIHHFEILVLKLIFVADQMDNPEKSAVYWATEFQKRNPVAFEHVFDLHYRALCYFAGTFLADQNDVEDTVAEVFVKLWEKAADFDSLGSIKGFLYICTKNRCLDQLKKYKREQASLYDYRYTVETVDETEDYGVLEAQVLNQLYEEIEQLPGKAREIFKLLFFEGLKTDEVATKLGISVKTVRNQKARAIQALQAVLFKKRLLAVFLMVSFLD